MSFEQRAEEIIAEIAELGAASAADQDRLLNMKASIEEKIGDDIGGFIESLLSDSDDQLDENYPEANPEQLAKDIDNISLELRRVGRRDDVRFRRMKNLMAEMSNFGGAL